MMGIMIAMSYDLPYTIDWTSERIDRITTITQRLQTDVTQFRQIQHVEPVET